MSKELYHRIKLPAFPKVIDVVPPKTYKGFSSITQASENYSLYDFDLIKQDILNHFQTRQGERLMQPKFGTIIWDLLFEPMTEQVKSLIKQDVDSIINYDPRVQIADTNIITYESGIEIRLSMTYIPYNITETILLKFDQGSSFLAQ
jgi:phage baseplate assembly protein W